MNETQIKLAASEVISRAVYPASELKTSSWIKENFAICEVTGHDIEQITKNKLYSGALKLYDVKDDLEKYLLQRTNDLFEPDDKIILYDLTNTYFEGRKLNSSLTQFGSSKEKHKDAKLVVLAMVVKIEGFIKYTTIHEGNIADCNTVSAMIDKLATHPLQQSQVVPYASIVTKENLELMQKKALNYVCVSRTRLKSYTVLQGRLPILLQTKSMH